MAVAMCRIQTLPLVPRPDPVLKKDPGTFFPDEPENPDPAGIPVTDGRKDREPMES